MKKSWDRVEFIEYLIEEKQLSKKVAADIASRCTRVEKSFGINLREATKSEDRLKSLHLEISKFGDIKAKTRERAYSLTGNLRLAVNYFAQFTWGKGLGPYSTYFRYGINNKKK